MIHDLINMLLLFEVSRLKKYNNAHYSNESNPINILASFGCI